jgi:hypothetical protein
MSHAYKPISVPVEIYTDRKALSGYIKCPEYVRLIDLFNNTGVERTYSSDFIEFVDTSDRVFGKDGPEKQPEYIRRDAIEMVAVSEDGLCRGVCASGGIKAYPFVHKVQSTVNVQLHAFILYGNIHLSQGQTIADLLNEDKAFLPLTEVDIIFEDYLYGVRPFAAVNKKHIISSHSGKREQSIENVNYGS